MQTRSQTRKLLIDPKNEMFEIPVVRPSEKVTTVRPTEKATMVRPSEKATTVRTTEKATTVRTTENATTERPSEKATTVRPSEKATTERPSEKATTVRPTERPTERPTTTKVFTRVLPDSIINGPSTPINCALFFPIYIQKPLYEVDIDFDEASEAWRSNKTSIGNGQYKYNKGTRRSLKIPY